MNTKLKIMARVIPLVFLLDQTTKWLIVQKMPLGGSWPVIPGIFDMVHTRNRGAAFGFMANAPESLRGPFFLVVSLVSLTLITLYLIKLKEERPSAFVCLSLILGGALGNLWDRFRLGEVVDFLSFHWYDRVARFQLAGYSVAFRLEWPAFNVADMAISVSVVWLMFLFLKSPQRSPKTP